MSSDWENALACLTAFVLMIGLPLFVAMSIGKRKGSES